jgi:hypothetical protein
VEQMDSIACPDEGPIIEKILCNSLLSFCQKTLVSARRLPSQMREVCPVDIFDESSTPARSND